MQKAGAQRLAAELGLVLVAPDTSPRGPDVPGDPDGAWDFGHGASFYLNATEQPWAQHYHMHDYVVQELPALVEAHFPVNDKRAISGHSHGRTRRAGLRPAQSRALPLACRRSRPSPTRASCPWGEKAFTRYLGADRDAWRGWNACALLAERPARHLPILVDQGDADSFLDVQLKPAVLQAAAAAVGQPLTLRLQPGYDHSYWFVASFIDDHLRHHAAALHG